MRRKSREVALQILFQTEFATQISYEDFLSVFEDQEPYTREVIAFADELIKGVKSNQAAIDALIGKCSSHWKIERMSSIDRNLLRIATFELKFSPNKLDTGIVINEAVELAKQFATPESGGFINGILDQVAKQN